MKAVPQGVIIAALGVVVIVAGLAFLPSEVLLGPAGLALILGGLAIAAKGAGA